MTYNSSGPITARTALEAMLFTNSQQNPPGVDWPDLQVHFLPSFTRIDYANTFGLSDEVCTSVCLYVCLYVCLSLCLSVYLYLHNSLDWPDLQVHFLPSFTRIDYANTFGLSDEVCTSVCLSVCRTAYLSVYLFLSLCLCLSV